MHPPLEIHISKYVQIPKKYQGLNPNILCSETKFKERTFFFGLVKKIFFSMSGFSQLGFIVELDDGMLRVVLLGDLPRFTSARWRIATPYRLH
jgi:hypothetical protein